MTIGQRIRMKREELGFTQEDVAKQVGCAIQTIYKYENEIVTNIPLDKIGKIAKALSVAPAYLMGWESAPAQSSDTASALPSPVEMEKYGLRPIEMKRFPMLGKIACGEPIYCNQDYETFIEASANIKADFCLEAKGDSMINARIFNGDIVFIRAQNDVENGEIAAVVIDDAATLKRVYKYQNSIELRAENPTHKPINLEGVEMETVRILGKAVAFQSNII